jgi:hypothetical protein
VGRQYTHFEKKQLIKEEAEDDIDIISHINGYIRSINAVSGIIDPNIWYVIRGAFIEKQKAINKYRDQIALDKSAEAVRWFEEADNWLKEKFVYLQHQVQISYYILKMHHCQKSKNQVTTMRHSSRAQLKGGLRNNAKVTKRIREKKPILLASR